MHAIKGFIGGGALLVALALSASSAHGQVAAADAQDFLGVWDVSMEGPQPVAFVLNIQEQDGRVTATANMMGNDSRVSSIQRRESALVLNYTVDFQGTPVGVSITMTPGENGMRASLSAAEGMFTASGTATKR